METTETMGGKGEQRTEGPRVTGDARVLPDRFCQDLSFLLSVTGWAQLNRNRASVELLIFLDDF